MTTRGPAQPVAGEPTRALPRRPAGAPGVWAVVRSGIGAALGILPHVMHHIGLLAGAALLTGALGNTILYAVGLLLSIPMLRRLRTKFATWWAPALGVVAFSGLFAFSAFVIGPSLSGDNTATPLPAAPTAPVTSDGHAEHH